MNTLPPKQRLMHLITGGWVSQAVYVAARYNIADHLSDGPLTAFELAKKINCNANALHRLLRALASFGVFEDIGDYKYALTDVGKCLCSGSPDSARAASIMITEIFSHTWLELSHSIETGAPAFTKIHGLPIFEYLANNEDHARKFDAAMVSWMNDDAQAIINAYDWPEKGKIVDVGGGSGGLLLPLLKRYPKLNGVIFDLQEVVARNRALHESDDTYANLEFVGGDFFKSVTKGADIYLLRNIIHDWDDEKSIRILNNCQQACHPDSKVLILESIIPEDNAPFGGKLLDLMMLVGVGGQERTEIEYKGLLEPAGLSLTKIIPTTTEMSIIETRPVSR